MSAEEQAEWDEKHGPSPEMQAELDKRADWDEKHARCGECGQFLKKRPPRPPGLFPDLIMESPWIGHHVQDYWGEWDHI